jgi:ribosomal protein L13
MTIPKPLRLIPAPGEPLTHEQAVALLDLYGDVAGEMAASVALTLREKGRIVSFWKMLTTDDMVRIRHVVDAEDVPLPGVEPANAVTGARARSGHRADDCPF